MKVIKNKAELFYMLNRISSTNKLNKFPMRLNIGLCFRYTHHTIFFYFDPAIQFKFLNELINTSLVLFPSMHLMHLFV